MTGRDSQSSVNFVNFVKSLKNRLTNRIAMFIMISDTANGVGYFSV